MNYKDCDRIIEATKPIFENTNYQLNYGLDGDIYFEDKEGNWIEFENIPTELMEQFDSEIEKLNIKY